MKTCLTLGLLGLLCGIALGLLQLWFALFAPAVFAKLIITLGVLSAVLLLVWYFVREHRQDQANRDGQRLN
ncbi:hypothetical protein SAMN02745857_01458 [Andreprevotia lacus DSM 23236]|jgi:membrane protein implicated in regulation of membrane protease activity|uniref:Uncharacterized protein n=1 Tax=Andreprevotia lacus DSM 23236 TaxID=1121001 RepID=A0A1W1XFL6_9NEIS|nr:hypothetical protein [Andreprevotia lacus]SMC22756.1 hypothetical protein SAMN02745857_01458 [Andreprevotia lacus DSM 23236]